MYKIIYQDMVIDVLEFPYYVRWIPRYGRFFPSDETSAHCVASSDEQTFYHVDTMPNFDGDIYKTVQMVKISKEEFDQLKSLIENGSTVYNDEVDPPVEEKLRRRIVELESQAEGLINQNEALKRELEEKIAELTEANDFLAECVLEMSEVVYA